MNSFTLALVGNPNIGKSTLFNQLTHGNQRIGNWPGLTVEKKQGYFNIDKHHIHVVDLPGSYSLISRNTNDNVTDNVALDESIMHHYLESGKADCIINIIDACLMERHLYLTMQLLESGLPMIVVANRMDLAEKQGLSIDTHLLSQQLGCPVIPTSAKHGVGIDLLKDAIATHIAQAHSQQNAADKSEVKKQKKTTTLHANLDQAQRDYQRIETIVNAVVKKQPKTPKQTKRKFSIDSIVLNRFLGVPLFLLAMYLLFVFSIDIGGAFQDFFDISSTALFVDAPTQLMQWLHSPAWLIALVANGIGRGINTVITFVPVLGVLFFCLAWLEESGYMARAAFVMDRIMRLAGLPGKSFIPMIIGFGCNVPAVTATRTLESPRERIVTIMMAPFMSCGARLAIYAVFTTAFFPTQGALIIFALYLIGIIVAFATGLILRKTLLPGKSHPMILELPNYQRPQIKSVLQQAWRRLKGFVWRAGRLIVPVCLCIGLLNTLPSPASLSHFYKEPQNATALLHSLRAEESKPVKKPVTQQPALNGTKRLKPYPSPKMEVKTQRLSMLAVMGQFLTPLLAPMGIHPNNWPATVGLLTGVLAKEVMVGSLNTLYSYTAASSKQTTTTPSETSASIGTSLKEAFLSIKLNLANLPALFLHPLTAVAPIQRLSSSVYGQMMAAFDGHIGAFAYLLFILLYFPCISTTAAMTRELNQSWAYFSMLWSTGLAYAIAVLFYQLGTLLQHPVSSLLWVGGILLFMASLLLIMRYYANRRPDLGLYVKNLKPQKNCSDKTAIAGDKISAAISSSVRCAHKCKGCQLEF